MSVMFLHARSVFLRLVLVSRFLDLWSSYRSSDPSITMRFLSNQRSIGLMFQLLALLTSSHGSEIEYNYPRMTKRLDLQDWREFVDPDVFWIQSSDHVNFGSCLASVRSSSAASTPSLFPLLAFPCSAT